MKESLRVLNILNIFESLVGSLVGIFVPIFLLSSGHSVRNIFIYYLLYSLVVFIFFFVAAFVASRWGLAVLFAIRYVFWFAYLLLLFFLPGSDDLIYYLAVASAISVAFFAFPFHIIFGKSVGAKKIGGQFGRIMLIAQVVGFFGPLLAAAMIKYFGYQALFAVALILMTASLYYLKFLPLIKTKISFSWTAWKKCLEKNQSYFWFEFFENMIEEIEGIIWPIYVYLVVDSIWSVAWVAMLASIGSMIFTWFISKRIDSWKRSQTLMISALLLAALWLSRDGFGGPWLYISAILMGLLGTVFSIGFNAMIYVRAKANNYDEFIVFREAPVFLARACLYLLAIVFVSHLNWFFALAAGLYMVLIVMLRLNKKLT
ncbi:MAG TPA: hypothetical protein PLJ58_02600 [bacterium]|nr:hypothetical protein [bacterium]